MSTTDWKRIASELHAVFVGNKWRVNSPEDVRFLTLAMCGEAGELANFVKKDWRGDVIDPTEMAKELADVRIYLELIAVALNVNLDSACAAKLLEVNERLQKR